LQCNKESAVNVLILSFWCRSSRSSRFIIVPPELPILKLVNISVQLRTVPVLGLFQLGIGVLMIAGEFILSVGSIACSPGSRRMLDFRKY